MRKDKAAYAAPAPELRHRRRRRARACRRAAPTTPRIRVLLRDQSRGDAVGDDVLTPLQLADGSAVLVDRGWVHSGSSRSRRTIAPPTAGTVIVRGIVNTPRPLSSQDTMPRSGRTRRLPRVDVASLARRRAVHTATGLDRGPVAGAPPAAARATPALPTPPPPDPVNHLEYAIEWFALALIPIIGWPIALVHFNRRKSGKQSTAGT